MAEPDELEAATGGAAVAAVDAEAVAAFDGAAVAAAALRWVGTPYVHGASLQGAGADCLGLVRGLWRELLGAEPRAIPPYAPDWAARGGGELLVEGLDGPLPRRRSGGLAEGDVVALRMRAGLPASHLGVIVGEKGGLGLVHAYSRLGVVRSPWPAAWAARVAAVFTFPARS